MLFCIAYALAMTAVVGGGLGYLYYTDGEN